MTIKMNGVHAILTDIHPKSQYYKDKDILIGKEIEFGEDLDVNSFFPENDWLILDVKVISKVNRQDLDEDNRMILDGFHTILGYKIKDFETVTFLASL